ncbi:hypothetical protein LUZ61_004509 [Rhynchospora tenuis]|uniref:BTB domain-containing protein n=1 Tax=Rhynchospora tenuis TaxID=198213 RepID=A0AAD5ZMW0_9POAL|nr:hypothetical protein LUZ61_004509 [Rhynchospora tenuis]
MDSSVTTSTVQAEVETGSHLFKVIGYSANKGIGIGKLICSGVFTVGNYDWVINFYPDGYAIESKDFISLYFELKSAATNVKTTLAFTILQHNGLPSNMSCGPHDLTFKSTSETSYDFWGFPTFIKRSEFEASKCLEDDAFTIKCTIAIVKGTHLQRTTPYGIPIPPSNLNQRLVRLLESGEGADVTFVVKGERFKAHRFMLAD